MPDKNHGPVILPGHAPAAVRCLTDHYFDEFAAFFFSHEYHSTPRSHSRM
jgi:hypothetical protein